MDKIPIVSLYRLRSLANKRLYVCRMEVVSNGNETFIKYGPQFCNKWARLIDRISHSIDLKKKEELWK